MHFTTTCINKIVSFTIFYYKDFKITIKSQIGVRDREKKTMEIRTNAHAGENQKHQPRTPTKSHIMKCI